MGAKKVIVSWANQKDVKFEVPKEVSARMPFVFVWMVHKVLDVVFKGCHYGAPLCQLSRDLPVQIRVVPPMGHLWPRKQDTQPYLQIKLC